jgi:hypothetical protein
MPNNTSLLVFMVFYFSAGESGNGTPKCFHFQIGPPSRVFAGGARQLRRVHVHGGERWAKSSMEKGKVQQGGVHGHLDQ